MWLCDQDGLFQSSFILMQPDHILIIREWMYLCFFCSCCYSPWCILFDPDHRWGLNQISFTFFLLRSCWLFSLGILYCYPFWWYKETALMLIFIPEFATKCNISHSRRNHRDSELQPLLQKKEHFLNPFLQANFHVCKPHQYLICNENWLTCRYAKGKFYTH